jgi:hypothetical protein
MADKNNKEITASAGIDFRKEGLISLRMYEPEYIEKVLSSKLVTLLNQTVRQSVMQRFDEHAWHSAPPGLHDGRTTVWSTCNDGVLFTSGSANCRLNNFGTTQTSLIPLSYNFGILDNATWGRYGTKAATACLGEEANFDTAFYRMNKRDHDAIWGYLFKRTEHQPAHFVSWFQEAFCHLSVSRSHRRNLVSSTYCARLTTLKDLKHGKNVAGQKALDVQHEKEANESFGVIALPGGANPHGDVDRKIAFVPTNEILDKSEFLSTSGSSVFVSKAKTTSELFSDIEAIWTGGLSEFGVYRSDVVMVFVNFRSRELESAFSEWGITFKRKGKLSKLFHYLSKTCQYTSGVYTAPTGDLMRIRDILAYSSVEVCEPTIGDWVRVMNTGDGDVKVTIPLATWKDRVSHACEIITLRYDRMESVGRWEDVTDAVYNRGLMLGHLIDHINQVSVGHWSNLRHVYKPDRIFIAINIALDYFTNCYWVDGNVYALGLHVNLNSYALASSVKFSTTGSMVLTTGDLRNRTKVLDEDYIRGISAADNESNFVEDNALHDDTWWICCRCDWRRAISRAYSGLIVSPGLRLDVQDNAINSEHLVSHEMDLQLINNFLSNSLPTSELYYYYCGSGGRKHLRLRLMHESVRDFVYWHAPVDNILKGAIQCSWLECISKDTQYAVDPQTEGGPDRITRRIEEAFFR